MSKTSTIIFLFTQLGVKVFTFEMSSSLKSIFTLKQKLYPGICVRVVLGIQVEFISEIEEMFLLEVSYKQTLSIKIFKSKLSCFRGYVF